MCVQNGYHSTKLFLFDGIVPIVDEAFIDVKEYSQRKKVIRSSDMVDLEAEMPKKKSDGKDDWFCTKCNVVLNIKTMFRLQICVQDESGTMSLTLWNDEVQPIVNMFAYKLSEK
ncbi:replication protein A 70 kDa DNA-binding subunit B [Tanacetum coccineum]